MIGKDVKNIDSKLHLTGKSRFVDDLPMLDGTLFAVVYGSPVAHAHIKEIDVAIAKKMPGVVDVITASDIKGQNQIGGIIADEPLLAEDMVHFNGMPVAVIVADTEDHARRARAAIKLELTNLEVIIDPRLAYRKEMLIVPSRTFKIGDTAIAWPSCEYVAEGTADMGGQEHAYLEPQSAYAFPTEDGNIKIYSSTQAPSYVQRGVATVLGLPMHKIEVDVTRLGGGFGGKEDQATHWATLAALAAQKVERPVKLVLHRSDDMRMTGKRHPYEFDFKIGVNREGKILAYEVTCFQNAGAAADLSPAIMERTLFHGGGSYYIPNANITVHSCKTNLPPNTAFRGFGAPQAMFVLECAITKVALEMGVDAMVIQRANLLDEGDEFPYGQIASGCRSKACWELAIEHYNVEKKRHEIEEFNATSATRKRGMAIFPLCFGISFTNSSLNQASALIHIYRDGSIGITTGVIEMGQSVFTKLLQIAVEIFSVDRARIKIESTNTTRVANASPTAASSGADLNGKAVEIAAVRLVERLCQLAAKELGVDGSKVTIKNECVMLDGKPSRLSWGELILAALANRVDLTEHAYYSTPNIYFDKTKEKGHPFAYHVYGSAITVVLLDCLRGVYEVESVHIVHDFGNSINPHIDQGQVEGGLMQGIGLMSIEELEFNSDGSLRSNSLSSYKIPDIYSAPKVVDIVALNAAGPSLAIFGSKAVGEPPLCYGIGVYFAALNAIKSYNPGPLTQFSAPMTFQKTLLNLYQK